MKNGSKVVIEVSGSGRGSVTVDDHAVRGVRSVSTRVEVDAAPIVTLEMMFGHNVKFEGATIVISNAAMPEAVELALWKHLSAKYNPQIDVTTVGSAARERALRNG